MHEFTLLRSDLFSAFSLADLLSENIFSGVLIVLLIAFLILGFALFRRQKSNFAIEFDKLNAEIVHQDLANKKLTKDLNELSLEIQKLSKERAESEQEIALLTKKLKDSEEQYLILKNKGTDENNDIIVEYYINNNASQ